MEKRDKHPFVKWIDHIWYYNKWMILLGGAAVLLVIVGSIQLLTKKTPDVHFMYVGKATISITDAGKLEDSVKELIEDYNEDGSINVAFLELTAHTEEVSGAVFDADVNAGVLRRFDVEVATGDSIIYLLDEYYYKKVLEIGVLDSLESVLGAENLPENTKDEYGIYLKDLDIYKTPGFSNLPDSTILCIRRFPNEGEISYRRDLKVFENNRDCFVRLVKYNH